MASEDTTEVATALLKLYFDPSFYGRTYPDVSVAKMDLLFHYVTYGHKEGRNPTPWFSSQTYRSEQRLSSEENPFLHFLRHNRAKADQLRASDLLQQAPQKDVFKSKSLMQPYYSLQLPAPPMGKTVVFTCIAGTRHVLPNNTTQHSDLRLFGDTPICQDRWRFSPCLYWDENPKIITLFHKYVMAALFPIGTRLIWVDSRVSLQHEIIESMSRLLDDADICAFNHYERDCVYDELAAILSGQRATLEQCESGERYLKSVDFPKHAGLFETGALGYKVSRELQVAMRQVFGLCKKYIHRDQIALPVVLSRHNLKVALVNQGKTNLRNTSGVFLHSW